jgi:hypothetical protein
MAISRPRICYGRGPMATRYPEHETKGVWFIAGRSYLHAKLGPEGYRNLLNAMPADYREVADAPLPSMWYPEDAAAAFLRAWLEVGAGGDRTAFATMVGEASEAGVGRFFRAIGSMASARFLLRRTPTIFKQMRRGPASVSTEDRDMDVVVRYHAFPFLEDDVYATCFPVQLAALVHATTGTTVETRVLERSTSSLTVAVQLL